MVGPRLSPGTRRLAGRLLPPLVFSLLALVLTAPLGVRMADHLRDAGDSYEYAWLIGFGAWQLRQAPLHLYDGNIFYPFPMSVAFSDSTVPSVLIGAPIVWLTGNPVLALNSLILLTFVLGGWGMYLLVKERTGWWGAGLVAGIAYAFSPYRYDHLAQLPGVSWQWAPFALWCFERYLATDRRRWAVGFAAFGLLQALVAFYYAFILGIGITIYVLVRMLSNPRHCRRWRWIAPLALASVVGELIAVPFVAPYAILSRTFGLARSLDEANAFGARFANYLAYQRDTYVHLDRPLVELWLRFAPDEGFGAWGRHLYPGLLIVVLAVVGLSARHPRRTVGPLLLVLVGLVLSFGPIYHSAADQPVALPFPMPYAVLYEYLPGFAALRVPARFATLVLFGLAMLGGEGMVVLRRVLQGRLALEKGQAVGNRDASAPARPFPTATSAAAGLALIAALVVSAEGWTRYMLTPVPVGSAIPPVYQWLAAEPEPGPIVELPIGLDPFVESPRAYFSTYHHRQLVNGARAFVPPGYPELAETLNTFPEPAALRTLRQLAVRFVVVHRDQASPEQLGRVDARPLAAGLVSVGRFGDAEVFRVDGEPAVETLRLTTLAHACTDRVGAREPMQLRLAALDGRAIVLPPGTDELTFAFDWRGADEDLPRELVVVPIPARVLPSPALFPIDYRSPGRPGMYTSTVTLLDRPGLRATTTRLMLVGGRCTDAS